MKRLLFFKYVSLAALLILLVVAPAVAYPVFLMRVLCFAIFAASFNLLLGYAGLLSFGHAAVFGFAAYVCGFVIQSWKWSIGLGIVTGVASAAAIGLVFGALSIRRQGIYFAMITLALSQMVYFFCVQAPFTGGEDGIQGVPRPPLFGLIPLESEVSMYYFVLTLFLGSMAFVYRVVNSPFGEVLRAIRENPDRATSLGYDVGRYKLLVFVISCALAGLAGSTKVLVFHLASLSDVEWHMSGEVVLMALVGGIGTMLGPLLGAGIVVAMRTYLAQFGEWVLVIQGVIFVIIVLAFREGIVGTVASVVRRTLQR
jgi:branched-chain amino acid transport system permease protein